MFNLFMYVTRSHWITFNNNYVRIITHHSNEVKQYNNLKLINMLISHELDDT